MSRNRHIFPRSLLYVGWVCLTLGALLIAIRLLFAIAFLVAGPLIVVGLALMLAALIGRGNRR